MTQPGYGSPVSRFRSCGRRRARLALAAGLVLAALAGAGVRALVNPRFTPVHLVKQSTLILHGLITVGPGDGEWSLQPAGVLKGETGEPQRLHLGDVQGEPARQIGEWLSRPGARAVLFASGAFTGGRGFVHVSGHWLAVAGGGPAAWNIVGPALALDGTYAGSTDMLVKMVRYIIEDPDADVPVGVGMAWRDSLPVARTAGPISGMSILELGGRKVLFVGSAGGDRLYSMAAMPDGRDGMEERTDAFHLDSRSAAFLWLDMDADGSSDLVSWDGAELSVRLMKAGRLQTAAAAHGLALETKCLGLSVAGLSPDSRPRVLLSTPGIPLLTEWSAVDGWTSRDLPGASSDVDYGLPSPCIVADLDGDGFPDILQPREKAGLLWRGAADGFLSPAESAVVSPGGAGCAAVGDFDGDGSLDIFVGSPRGNELWENDGNGRFRPVLADAGSLGYKLGYGVSAALGSDLNHDGRPDLLLGSPEAGLVCHFNRGYRCFAEEGELRLNEVGDVPIVASWGVQAMAAGDLDGNDSADLAVALEGGEVFCYVSSLFRVYGVRVKMPPGAIGPVTASAWRHEGLPVCSGTWSICDPAQPVLFSMRGPGHYALRCRFRGGPARTCDVLADEDLPVVLLPGWASDRAGD